MLRTAIVPKDKWRTFWKRAKQYHKSMHSIPIENTGPVVSSAVFCGIAAIDSILVFKEGKHASNHDDAAMLFNGIRTSNDSERKRIDSKFRELLKLKNKAQYDDDLSSKKDAEKALSLARDIFTFVENELKLIGADMPQD